jgi:hypothetical protein
LLEDRSNVTYLTREKAALNGSSFAVQLPSDPSGSYAWRLGVSSFTGQVPSEFVGDGRVLDVYANVCRLTLADTVSTARRIVTVPVGSSYVLDPVTHDGYIFDGWAPAGAVVGGRVTVASSMELTANYRKINPDQVIHEILYYDKPAGQGGNVIYRQPVVAGGSVTEFPHPAYNPTLAGYTFQRWDATLPMLNVTANRNVYPVYEAHLKASFYDWQDDVQPLFTAFVARGTFATYQGPALQRAGYDFIGWYPDPAKTPVMSDTDFVAQYQAKSDNLYLLTVYYSFPNGTVAAQPHIATLPLSDVPYTVTSPAIVGFNADKPVVTVTTDENTPKEIVITVTYNPSTGTPYIVRHYQQKLGVTLAGGIDTDINKYNLADAETFHSTTGSVQPVAPKNYPGFTLVPDQDDEVQIAADGSTVFNLFYSRNTYAVYFDSKGGSYIPPVVAEFDAALTAPGNPTRPGYVFTGWNKPMPAKMPVGGDRLEASWQKGANVSSTLSFWLENAEGPEYDV